MKSHRRLGIFLIVLTLVASMLACSVGAKPTATPEPTNTPRPTRTPQPTDTPAPTNTPVPPTNTPEPEVVPTEAPEAEVVPTEAPEVDVPTGETEIVEGALNVIAVASFKDDYDTWHFTGLISNNMDRAVDDVEVEIEIFDASENSLYKETTGTELWTLAPGDVTPFAVYVYEDLPGADHFVATIVGQGSTEVERADVTLLNVNVHTDDYGDVYLVGEMVNNGSEPAVISDIAAALFSSDDELVTGFSSAYMLHYLEGGETGPFRVSLSAPADVAESIDSYTYQIYLDTMVSDYAELYDLTLSEEHSDYMDAFDSLHLVGELTNNSTVRVSPSLVGAIYDANGYVLDVASATTPFFSVEPGEKMPYEFTSWGLMNYNEGMFAEQADTYSVFVDWHWTWESYFEQVTLTTSDDANTFDGYQMVFTGNVLNNSGGTVESVIVAVAIYDTATGNIFATGYTYVFDIEELADNASAPYELSVSVPSDFNLEAYEYVLTVKASKP